MGQNRYFQIHGSCERPGCPHRDYPAGARGGRLLRLHPALPGCHTQGETLKEVRANLREAAEGWLAVAHDDALARGATEESK